MADDEDKISPLTAGLALGGASLLGKLPSILMGKRLKKKKKKAERIQAREREAQKQFALTELDVAGQEVREKIPELQRGEREEAEERGVTRSTIATESQERLEREKRKRLAAIARRRARILAGGAAEADLARIQSSSDRIRGQLEQINAFLEGGLTGFGGALALA